MEQAGTATLRALQASQGNQRHRLRERKNSNMHATASRPFGKHALNFAPQHLGVDPTSVFSAERL